MRRKNAVLSEIIVFYAHFIYELYCCLKCDKHSHAGLGQKYTNQGKNSHVLIQPDKLEAVQPAKHLKGQS